MNDPHTTSIPYEVEDHREEPCPDWWCYIHRAIETPSHPDEAWVCGECWHVYADKADVERVERERWGDQRPFDQILCCPLCVHDW